MHPAHLHTDEIQYLQAWNCSVRLENLQALMRRWRLVKTGALDAVGCTELLFPGQRDLLDSLSGVAQADILRIGDFALPLFALDLPQTERALDFFTEPDDVLHLQSSEESFVALVTRQDLVRRSPEPARIAFGLTGTGAQWLSRLCPRELYALSRDPSMVLRQSMRWNDFLAAAAKAGPARMPAGSPPRGSGHAAAPSRRSGGSPPSAP